MEQEKIKEIKKVLMNCQKDNCIDCPYLIDEKKCRANDLLIDTLNLINELESENEVLRKHNIGYHVANGYELQEFAEKVIEKLKDKVNSDNVDAVVECKRIIKEVMKKL